MNYNDSQIMSDTAYISCNSAYEKLSQNNTHDLYEILEKLESQKRDLSSTKNDYNNPQILSSLDSSIASIRGLLSLTEKASKADLKSTSQSSKKFSQNIRLLSTDINPYTYTENRSDSISNYMASNDNNVAPNNSQNITPNRENTVSPSDNILPNNRRVNRQTSSFRGSPQQGNFITKLLSKFAVGSSFQGSTQQISSSKQLGKTSHYIHSTRCNNVPIDQSKTLEKSSQNTQSIRQQFNPHSWHNRNMDYCHISPESPSKPPHRDDWGHDHHEPCDANKKIVSRQFDIVRLLLLYLSLRPHYPYCYRICRVAEEQFSILSNIVEI